MPNRATLRDARRSRLPAAIGECADNNSVLLSTINEAQQRLILEPTQPDEGWWGTYAVMAFNVTQDSPYITTPRGVARMTLHDICKKPVLIRNQFYEYLEFGNGLRPVSCCESPLCENLTTFDRGTVPTFVDLPEGNVVIRAFVTDETDVGKTTLIGIKDATGAIVYSQDGFDRVQGELLTFAEPFVVTSNQVTEILGIQKDITNGQVKYYAVDVDTDESTLLLTMEPGETTACYRRYFINGLPQCCGCGSKQGDPIQVKALVKLDFVPAVVDTDYLIIQNLAALKEECQSIRYEEMDIPNSKQMAEMHHARALRLLFGELDQYVGKNRVSISVPLFNSDPMPAQPI